MNAIAIAVAIPVFFSLIGVERWAARRRGDRVYRFQDSITSLNCGVVQQATAVFQLAAGHAGTPWAALAAGFVVAGSLVWITRIPPVPT